MSDEIHIEQFLNLEQNKSETERLEKEVRNWMEQNMCNTAIQLVDLELIMQMMRVDQAYQDKDYSNFLNEEAQSLLNHYESNKENYKNIVDKMQTISTSISKMRNGGT